jgi:hypothetical protein
VTFYTAFVIDLASRRIQISGRCRILMKHSCSRWVGRSRWPTRGCVAS